MITLYRTKLSPERNALVDDLDLYLNSCEKEGPIECQYVKHDLDIEIKLNLPQDILSRPVYNYVAIQNENDSLVYYYFIMDMKWTAKSTVRLVLSIDSVNTFRDRLEWSEKTNVLREHRDRFTVNGASRDLTRIVDEVDEGIVPTQLLLNDIKVRENNKDINWYLMYRTKNELTPNSIANPVECFAFASEPLPITRSTGTGSITYNAQAFAQGKYYYFTYTDNGAGVATSGDYIFTLNATTHKVYRITRSTTDTTKIEVRSMSFDSNGNFVEISVGPRVSSITFVNMVKMRITNYDTNQYNVIEEGTEWLINAGNYTAITVMPLSAIDRTDSRIMKIIELPYAPFNATYDAGSDVWTIPSGWTWSEGLLKLDDLNSEFLNNVASLYVNELSYMLPYVAGDARLLEEPHDSLRESKLYNSNFYTYKLAYDNFYAQVAFERFRNIQARVPTIMLEFKPTNTINSTSIFKWAPDGAYYKKIADYEEYIPCSRNNEISIFSNDYVNYIRTGYNYDKKIKNWSTAQR